MNQIIIDEQTIAHIKYQILGRSIYMILDTMIHSIVKFIIITLGIME